VTRVLNTEYNLSVETMAKIALALDARISLRMVPREEVERRPRSSAPSRTARRRERQHELASPLLAQNIATDRPARGQRNEFVTSDKPAPSRRTRRGLDEHGIK
jgi:hypothetical protein